MPTSDVVFQISVILGAGGVLEEGRAKQLAEAYDAAYRSAKERLRSCRDLLYGGNRRDARRVATQEPDLREEVRLLNFDERAEWVGLCQGFGFDVETGLEADGVQQLLEEIYGQSRECRRLLKLHRRMAMGRAPLVERLAVLRKIYAEDPENDFWLEDVRTFEAARAEELAREALAADKTGNIEALERVLAALNSDAWVEPPSPKFARGVEKLMQPHRETFARKRFDQVARTLEDRFGNRDEDGCVEALHSIRQLTEQTGVQPDGRLAGQITDVGDWLNELAALRQEDETYDNLCQELGAALDRGRDLHVLERLSASVLAFKRGMPELLATRVTTRMTDLRAKARRRFVLRATAVVGALLLVAAGVVGLVWWQGRESEAAESAALIERKLEDNDLEAAAELLDAVEGKPWLNERAEIRALAAKYRDRMDVEKTRLADFNAAMTEVTAAGVAAPNLAALSRAEGLARTPGERSRVDDWKQRIQADADDRRRRRWAEFDAGMTELNRMSTELTTRVNTTDRDFQLLAARCLEKADVLMAMSDVTAERLDRVKGQKDLVEARIRQVREAALKQKTMADALAKIRTLYDQPEQLGRALLSFGTGYSGHPLAAELIRAKRMDLNWRAAASGGALITTWGGRLRVTSAEDARKRRDEINETYAVLGKGFSPYDPYLTEYDAYLALAERVVPGGKLARIDEIVAVLKGPLVGSAQVVRTVDGHTYTVVPRSIRAQKRDGKVTHYTFEYTVAREGTRTRKTKTLPVGQLANTTPVKAPQSVLAETALKRISDFSSGRGRGWETFTLSLAKLTQDAKDVDPVLRAILLKMLLDQAKDAVPFRVDEVKTLHEQLRKTYTDVPWMDPDDADVEVARRTVKGVLDRMAPLGPMIDGIEKETQTLFDALSVRRPVGVLLGDADEITLADGAGDGTLFVIWRDAGGPPTFRKVGAVSGGKVVLDADARGKYPQGSLLYLRDKS